MKKYLLMAAVTAAMLLTGCGPKEEPTNTVVLEKIRIFPASISLLEGESQQLTIRYTPEKAKEIAPPVIWYSERQRIASVDDNGMVKADRVGTTVITAQCGKLEAICTVDVLKNDLPTPDPEVKFSVEPKKIEAPAEGGSFQIEVKSNVAWTAALENSEWATLSATSGEGDATLTLTVAGSEDPEIASQDITFTAGKGSYYVRVTRAGYKKLAALSLDKTEAKVDVSGGSFTIQVTSEATWNVTCDDKRVSYSIDGSNILVTVGKSTSEGVKNKNESEQGEEIIMTVTNGDRSVPFTIRQTYPYIIVTILSGSTHPQYGLWWDGYEAHDFTFKIESNISWKIEFEYLHMSQDCSVPDYWAHVSQSSGTGDATLTLSVDENTRPCNADAYMWVRSAGGYASFNASGYSASVSHGGNY